MTIGLITVLQFPGFISKKSSAGVRVGLIKRLTAIVTAVTIGLLLPACLWLFAPDSGDAYERLPNSLCLLSFDAEEDWRGKESTVQSELHPGDSFYLGTFDYVTSGYLYKLVDGLTQRGIKATFYCTPNLAKAHPEALRKIAKAGHEIAVHLHPHQGRQVVYPFLSKYDKDLNEYPKDAVAEMIAAARHEVENAAQVSTTSFRSGEWSCDAGVERMLCRLGFQSFSNHEETFRLPCGMWNVATGKSYDMIISPEKMLLQIMAKKDGGGIIPCFSHPMVGFDYVRKTPDEAGLEHYFSMLDLAIERCPNVKYVTTSEAVALLRETSPSMSIKGGFLGVLSIVNLLLAIVCLRCSRCLSPLDES